MEEPPVSGDADIVVLPGPDEGVGVGVSGDVFGNVQRLVNLAELRQAGENDKQVESASIVAQQRRKQGPIPDIGSGAGFADEEDVMSVPGQAGQIGVGRNKRGGFLGEGNGFGREAGQGTGFGDGLGLEKWKRCLGKG